MVTLVDAVNRALTPLFDLLCWPFRSLPPIWAMLVISCLSGVAMVWIFGRTSDQDRIRHLREQIRGNLIGVRLFQRDVGVILRLQRRIFGDTFRYMRLALVPMVVLLVPVLLIMTQLNLRFAIRPLAPGEAVVVKALVRDAELLGAPARLEAAGGVQVETPAVRMPAAREVAWRVRATSPGEHRLVVHVGSASIETHLIAGEGWGAVPGRRTGRGFIDTLLYPGEPPIAGDHAIEAVEIGYAALDMRALGWPVHWLVAFFVLSIAFGFALKGPLGVEL